MMRSWKEHQYSPSHSYHVHDIVMVTPSGQLRMVVMIGRMVAVMVVMVRPDR